MTSYVSIVDQKLMFSGGPRFEKKLNFPVNFCWDCTLFSGILRKAYVLDRIPLSFFKVYLKSSVEI